MTPLRAPGWRIDWSACPVGFAQVLIDARRCIGMAETPRGSNSGVMVDVWLRQAGSSPGQPWCASFLTALYQRLQPAPIPRLASALKIRQWAEQHGRLLPDGAPLLPGDICGLVREDGHGHVGMVVAVDGEQLSSIEGNVESAVRGRVHPRSAWQWFVRPWGTL